MMNSPYKVVSSKIAWECPWYHVRQDQIVLPDGEQGVYNVVTRPDGAAFIIPVLPSGEIMLIRHYRHTVNEWLWEVPAGGIKAGQSAEEAAIEELAEEIGGTTNSMRYLGNFYTAVGFCDEVCHIFLAADVTLGATAHEPLEFMEMVPTDPKKAFEMARNGMMKDALSALALLWAEPHLIN
ncbi:MAG: ADP-ribose pyrophosphatase [Cellvibrionaceae bacterium]|jgi:ADP-ribose pyrophosphatase